MLRRILLTTIATLCLAPLPALADEATAVTRIGKLGGKVRRDGKLPGKPVVEVNLQSTAAKDADLKSLRELKRLKVLYLGYGTRTTDAGLVQLKTVTSLEELNLPETQVTDAGLAHLKGLKNLRKLGLTNCKGITNQGLVHLKGLKKLTNVAVYGTQVTERGAAELQKALPDVYVGGALQALAPGQPTAEQRQPKPRAQARAGTALPASTPRESSVSH